MRLIDADALLLKFDSLLESAKQREAETEEEYKENATISNYIDFVVWSLIAVDRSALREEIAKASTIEKK